MRPAACLTAAIGVMMVLPALGQGVAPRDAVAPPRPAPQASSALPHLAGRVTAASDGTPLRRAVIGVTANGRVRGKVLTDNDGRFEIDVPASETYAVRVTKAGYVPVSLPRPATRSGTVTLDLSLARSAVISGRVTDPGGHPVVSIRVRIQRADTTGFPDVYTVTDDLATFRVAGLATGTYSVRTMGAPEYLNVTDARQLAAGGGDPLARQPSSDAMTVDATVAAEYDVPLAYQGPAVILPYASVGGVVTGQITDEAGEAAAGLTVQLMRLSGLVDVPSGASPSAPRMTDDRGRYRFFHLRAGRYAIVVTDESTQTASGESSWLPIYYPGTAAPADAVSLSIDRHEELTGMDMVFTSSRGARVFGIALDAAGRPLQLPVSLVAPNIEWPVAPQVRTVAVDADGGFAFENVPPGDYALRAAPSGLRGSLVISGGGAEPLILERRNATVPGNPEFAIQPLQVTDADAGPWLLRTAPPATLRGHIVFEGMPPPSVRFELQAYTTDPYFATSPGSGTGLVADGSIDVSNWTFEVPLVAGPIRLRLSAAPPGWWLKSAYIGSVNAAEFPVTALTAKDSRDDITLVVSGTAATLTGRTMRTASQPEPGALVIAFSANREHWFSGSPWIQRLYSNEAARFSVTLPPGDYWVVALNSPADDFGHRESDWADMLDPLTSRARRVTLGEGRTLSVNAPVVSLKD